MILVEIALHFLFCGIEPAIAASRLECHTPSWGRSWWRALSIGIADLATARSLEITRVTTFPLDGRVEEIERIQVMRIELDEPSN
ncbi:MAG TPA: hypothetical protein VMO47_07330 [Rhodothermales bacterium]|nr:hypothetical protein [Rhodothermales bacterium]